uniref:isoaspartyl peptidase/L-asparaginase n=1 Tax=Chelativorans sp. YIM 93263 TaxID=2906648 RepID=UPI002379408A|nr:isoaspartyl peptidase/L-asparaginase [Chelativorans sp. YIM 93263]
MPEAEQVHFYQGLAGALSCGRKVLQNGGEAVEAVEQTVVALEENRLFNAGSGSVLTSEATVEMDAAIMDGCSLNAGAVIGLKTVRNPVRLARQVMDKSDHVVLALKELKPLQDTLVPRRQIPHGS